ncbi:MAG TPA: hypothetical protein VLE89_06235 [Chlamydiales bacterium]|nr:hypothetical protein [Chlamydiales bacterium]
MSILPINPDPPLPQLMGQVIEQKRANLQEKIDNRFKGSNFIKEVVYVTSDVGTAGFSMAQGVSLVTTPSAGLLLVGSISGLIGGVLNIGQGLFLLFEAMQSLRNGQYKQFSRVLADALLLIGIGLVMTLASLSILGVKLGCLGGAAAAMANPYVMPIFILLLVLPGLIQTLSHLAATAQGKDVGSLMKLDEIKKENHPHLQVLSTYSKPEQVSEMMEKFSEEIGVEAAIESLDLLKLILEKADEKVIKDRIDLCRKKIAEWNRLVRLRALQLSLYGLTFPLGLTAGCLSSGISKVVNAVSKFFLAAPSSMGAYMDAFEPFKRNGAIAVPKVSTF